MNSVTYSPKLIRRLRALLLAQKEAYRRLETLMGLQDRALDEGQYQLFLDRRENEEAVMAELTSLDRVIAPLLEQFHTFPRDQRLSPSGESLLHADLGDAEAARRSALEAHRRCQERLEAVRDRLTRSLPRNKRLSRFAGGAAGRPPRLIDFSA